ncbi:helix-turn-helix domain-containing protein [Cohnella thailandensis]|uniref:Helix-turn-helix domain-containing protein n=1 Tax=Cohnella thailandensis TaxID=557557 RepID=A0A841SQ32_9BACL|nr:helix-turn-helix domain-containing protein [Cohnella thailandensis]MBP1972444.1 AraC family transcriptional regulator of arabinose operon [Cohnella thailandensis]
MLKLNEIRQDRAMEWFEEAKGDQPYFTLVFVSYGKCVYWVNQAKMILEKGDGLLIPFGTPYYAKSIPSVFHEKFVLTFFPAVGSARLELLGEKSPVRIKIAALDGMIDRLRTIVEENEDKTWLAEVRAEAILAEILVLWSRERRQGPVSPAVDYNAQRMKDYIQEYYREKITKEILGAHIGRSPNYAASLFRRATGQTISEFVHVTRMKKAVYLLKDSLLTVGEISEMLGYRDVSYFNRLFKKTTGKNPSDYMRER